MHEQAPTRDTLGWGFVCRRHSSSGFHRHTIPPGSSDVGMINRIPLKGGIADRPVQATLV